MAVTISLRFCLFLYLLSNLVLFIGSFEPESFESVVSFFFSPLCSVIRALELELSSVSSWKTDAISLLFLLAASCLADCLSVSSRSDGDLLRFRWIFVINESEFFSFLKRENATAGKSWCFFLFKRKLFRFVLAALCVKPCLQSIWWIKDAFSFCSVSFVKSAKGLIMGTCFMCSLSCDFAFDFALFNRDVIGETALIDFT